LSDAHVRCIVIACETLKAQARTIKSLTTKVIEFSTVYASGYSMPQLYKPGNKI